MPFGGRIIPPSSFLRALRDSLCEQAGSPARLTGGCNPVCTHSPSKPAADGGGFRGRISKRVSARQRYSAVVPRFIIRELGSRTWSDFERIVEKHHGVWGGCWCVVFHLKPIKSNRTAAQNKADKEKLVRSNKSHAALVYEGKSIAGWCQFGPPAELPARMTGYARLGLAPPDWRITCFFVDRDRRKLGVAKAALAGSLRLIAAKGGGTVDGYPVDTGGKPTPGSFLWSGTESMFAELGFRPIGHLGPSKLVMRRTVRRN